MKKLTEEQAARLMEELHSDHTCRYDAITDEGYKKIFKIIRKWTDKEFPAIELPTGWQDERARVTLSTLYDGAPYIVIETHCKSTAKRVPAFTLERFKEFVVECNKIVGWIDEQKLGIR